MIKKARVRSVFPKPIYLGAATRSPIGKFGGSLSGYSAPQLASLTLRAALLRASGASEPVDYVIMGHARQAGTGPNPARQAAIFAGLPESVPAFTLNQACASGMSAVVQAAEKIALGRARSIWAGGVESMSNTPYLLPGARWGYRMGEAKVVDGMYRDGFMCPMAQMIMGETVEKYLAQAMGISRSDQDAFALESQKRAHRAWEDGRFTAELAPIEPDLSNPRVFPGLKIDEHRRGDATLESLAKLPAVFDRSTGTVTAGNSSGITDGASFLNVSDLKHGHAQAELLDSETVALDPRKMGLGPVEAVKRLLFRQGLLATDLDTVELNEAFAAQVIACQKFLEIPYEKLNPWGGSIALGHPIGCTGTRIIVTLIHQLLGQSGALGIATLCVSGGQGMAVLVRAL